MTALNEAVLVDSRLVEDVVIMQRIHAEVRPAARRVVKHVDVDGDTVQVDDAEIQTLLDSRGVLVLQRPC